MYRAARSLFRVSSPLLLVGAFTYLPSRPDLFKYKVHASFKASDNSAEYYPFLSDESMNLFLKQHPNIKLLNHGMTTVLLSKLRRTDTRSVDFRHLSDRLIRLLLEEYLGQEPKKIVKRHSPIGIFDSTELLLKEEDYCVISIMRSGNTVLNELLHIMPGIAIGKILLQRDPDRPSEPKFFYQKFPADIKNKRVIIFDPMLASGGSIIKTVENLIGEGCDIRNITFINIVSCVEGLERVSKVYPNLRIFTAAIDPILLEKILYIAPGLGDFGDRYYGTE